jgi:hypothetical protein
VDPSPEFRNESQEFWAVVKLTSQLLGFSVRKTNARASRVKTYTPDDLVRTLHARGLDPSDHSDMVEHVASYSVERARLMEEIVRPNLMDRDEARTLFMEISDDDDFPAELISMNKQTGDKRHEAYLASVVNILTWRTLIEHHHEAVFDYNPRGPLTFSHDGMPLRTLFR